MIDKAPADAMPDADRAASRGATKLELVDSRDLEEDPWRMQDIGNKAEIRHTPALHMLGHRLGVIAGRPALDPDDVPLGPLALAEALQHALHSISISASNIACCLIDFDPVVMGPIGEFYDV